MGAPGLVSSRLGDDRTQVVATGDWTAANAGVLEPRIDRLAEGTVTGDVVIDLAGIARFDTFGAWLMERLRRQLEQAGARVEFRNASAHNRSLIAELAQANLSVPPAAAAHPHSEDDWSARTLLRDTVSIVSMFGAALGALFRVAMRPSRFRLTSFISQFDRVGWQALPIVVLVTFIIGAIIAQQGFFHFRRFGADLYVIDLVGFLITREIGVLLVAIMVAGRSGSAFTAELGSMKMREEIDALRTMGLDPVEVLILPRILVMVIALPALTFIGSMAALLGAGVVATTYAGMTTQLFVERLQDAISLTHFQVGMIKAPFIGAVIGVIACTEGLQVRGSASSLGRHTTRSVVKAIFMVIVVDGFFAVFFTAIGM